jgi:hypothetical protein
VRDLIAMPTEDLFGLVMLLIGLIGGDDAVIQPDEYHGLGKAVQDGGDFC